MSFISDLNVAEFLSRLEELQSLLAELTDKYDQEALSDTDEVMSRIHRSRAGAYGLAAMWLREELERVTK